MNRRRRSVRTALILSVLVSATLWAFGASAATAADNINNADFLGYSFAEADNTTGFGIEANEPLTANDTSTCVDEDNEKMSRTAWYFIVGTGRPVTVTTGGSNFDTVLA